MVIDNPTARTSRAAGVGAFLACALFVAPASAAVLYKSIGPNGVLQFSDLPPEKGQAAERIRIPGSASSSAIAAADAGMPRADPMETDAAVTRASAQLDLAEHALAEARRQVAGDYEPLRLVSLRMSPPDAARVDYYKKNVLVARQTLLEVMKDKRKEEARQVTMTASNTWIPVNPTDRR